MFNLTRKGLWAHKVRFVLTGLAVILGVAFMAGTMILTDTMGKTFDGLFATANEGIDVVVHRTTGRRRPGMRCPGAGRRRPGRPDRGGRRRRRRRRHHRGLRPARRRRRQGHHRRRRPRRHHRRQLDRPTSGSTRSTCPPATRPTVRHEVVLDQATVEAEGWALGDTVGVLAKDGADRHDHRRHRHVRRRRRPPRHLRVAVDDATAQAMFAAAGHATTPSSWPPTAAPPTPSWPTAVAGRGRLRSSSRSSPAPPTRPTSRPTSRRTWRSSAPSCWPSPTSPCSSACSSSTTPSRSSSPSACGRWRCSGPSAPAAGRCCASVLLESAMVGAGRLGRRPGRRCRRCPTASGRSSAPSGSRSPSGDVVITTGTVVTAFVVGCRVTLLSARSARPCGPAASSPSPRCGTSPSSTPTPRSSGTVFGLAHHRRRRGRLRRRHRGSGDRAP